MYARKFLRVHELYVYVGRITDSLCFCFSASEASGSLTKNQSSTTLLHSNSIQQNELISVPTIIPPPRHCCRRRTEKRSKKHTMMTCQCHLFVHVRLDAQCRSIPFDTQIASFSLFPLKNYAFRSISDQLGCSSRYI